MTVEEVIADTLLHYVDPPGRTLWGKERSEHMAQSILSALKAAGLVIVPEQREFICKSCYLRAEEGKEESQF